MIGCVDSWLAQQEFNVEGSASDLEGNLIYVERLRHTSNDSGGSLLVEYSDPEGNPLADKQVTYDCNATTPSFVLYDRTSGDSEGVNWSGKIAESFQGKRRTDLQVPDG